MQFIDMDNSTIYCHGGGNVTHSSAIQLDRDKDIIISVNFESTLYFQENLKNNWMISKYHHNRFTGHVRRGTGENLLIRVEVEL